jgi:hypothetical protein
MKQEEIMESMLDVMRKQAIALSSIAESLNTLAEKASAAPAKPAVGQSGDSKTITGQFERLNEKGEWLEAFLDGQKYSTKKMEVKNDVQQSYMRDDTVKVFFTEKQNKQFVNRYINRIEVVKKGEAERTIGEDPEVIDDDVPF